MVLARGSEGLAVDNTLLAKFRQCGMTESLCEMLLLTAFEEGGSDKDEKVQEETD